MSTILLVEDDAALRRALSTSLRARGFDVCETDTGEAAIAAHDESSADLVVLDLALPGIGGLDVLAHLRTTSAVPVIVLSARETQRDKVSALDAGADDYITKPFDPEELLARIRAALRRPLAQSPEPATIVIGDLEIDLGARQMRRRGRPIHLTKTELSLLEALVTNPGKLMTHDVLLRSVWGPSYGTESHYLRVYIAQLRRKLGDDASGPRMILTEPGLGYRWIGTADPD